MQTRKLGPFDSSAIGLGGMCLSHAYGTPPDRQAAAAVLLKALDLGYTHIDSAALYGFGANETLIGEVLSGRRSEFILVTKGGMFRNAQGQREIDGRPEMIKKNCEESLQRLKTDVIDVYYLHRWDKRVPIEESVGALADLVKEGKVKTIGLSEVSAATLRKAHAVHPVAALQTEYSLWTRNAEVAVLDTFKKSTSRRTSPCATACRRSLASRAARWRRRPSRGSLLEGSTSFQFPARRAWITSKKTPAPNRFACRPRRSRNSTI
jgi:aryl-alcohol dehydrogenase-like predicted oxidoreductase